MAQTTMTRTFNWKNYESCSQSILPPLTLAGNPVWQGTPRHRRTTHLEMPLESGRIHGGEHQHSPKEARQIDRDAFSPRNRRVAPIACRLAKSPNHLRYV